MFGWQLGLQGCDLGGEGGEESGEGGGLGLQGWAFESKRGGRRAGREEMALRRGSGRGGQGGLGGWRGGLGGGRRGSGGSCGGRGRVIGEIFGGQGGLLVRILDLSGQAFAG